MDLSEAEGVVAESMLYQFLLQLRQQENLAIAGIKEWLPKILAVFKVTDPVGAAKVELDFSKFERE